MFDNALFYLPSESNRVLVGEGSSPHGVGVRISCTIPAKKRVLHIKWGYDAEAEELFVPDILWDQYIAPFQGHGTAWACNCVLCVNKAKYANQYRVWAYKIEDGKVMVAPYELANVGPDGHICWGYSKYSSAPPLNLRDANNFFWTAPFTSSMFGDFCSHLRMNLKKSGDFQEHIRNYFTPEANRARHWKPFQCPTPLVASNQHEDAVLLSTDKVVMDHFSDEKDRVCIQKTVMVVAFANETEDGDWELRVRDRTLRLSADKFYHAVETARQKPALAGK
jgi:hypothetical protein